MLNAEVINKLSFSLWFVFGYATFFIVSMLISVYCFGTRGGMAEIDNASFAIEQFSISIMISAIVVGAGFFVGVILSDCRKGSWLGIVLGIGYAVFALFSMAHANKIHDSLSEYTSILICVLWFLGGLILPIFVNIEQLTKKYN